jgi:glycosyltransferase involved in cell wall biosynthesis
VEGELSQYDYNQILSQLDIVVLPYRPDNFAAKTSNIFSEAIGLGKIVIAPLETLMGKILKKLGIGIAYFPYSSEALSKGIVEALTHYDVLRRRSYAASDQWRKENSSGAFLGRLLAISEIHN